MTVFQKYLHVGKEILAHDDDDASRKKLDGFLYVNILVLICYTTIWYDTIWGDENDNNVHNMHMDFEEKKSIFQVCQLENGEIM